MLLKGWGRGRDCSVRRGRSGWTQGPLGGEKSLEGAAESPLTRLVPIKLRVKVQFRVKGHLDLISHHQPLVGDRMPRSWARAAAKRRLGAEAAGQG